MQPELSPTLKAFCEHEELLRLAYLDRQGFPRVVPVWFVMIDGAYYVGTGVTSAKWHAMQRDARIGWVIDGGPRSGYKGACCAGMLKRYTMPPGALACMRLWGGSILARSNRRNSSRSSVVSMILRQCTYGLYPNTG